MDTSLQSKTKRRPKKIPHCLSKPKQSTNHEDLPIEEELATISREKKKTHSNAKPKRTESF